MFYRSTNFATLFLCICLNRLGVADKQLHEHDVVESHEIDGDIVDFFGIPQFPRYNPAPVSRDKDCSLDRLRKLMHKSMTDNVRETKQNIHTNIGSMDGGTWSIICAECNFSYMAHAQDYCIHSRYNITCLPLGLRKHRAVSHLVLIAITIVFIRIYLCRTAQSFFPIRSIESEEDRETTFFYLLSSFDEELLNCTFNTWLHGVENYFVFSTYKPSIENIKNRTFYQKFQKFDYWNRIRSQSRFVGQFLVSHNGNEPDWYVFSSDNTFISIKEMKLELSYSDSSYAYYSTIAKNNEEKTELDVSSSIPVTILSRGAFSLLMKQIRSHSPGCEVTGNLKNCLETGIDLHLQQDSNNDDRFLTLNRHFEVGEMNRFKKRNGGNYFDSAQTFTNLSPQLISFHNLTCSDMTIIDVLIRKVKV